jgi:uncharacterized membrane protein YqiK
MFFALGVAATLLVVIVVLVFVSGCVRLIPNNRIGIVEKLWSSSGSVRGGLIALHGEAGFQPDILRGGVHFFKPFQYRVHRQDLVTVPQGQIGYVFARDGQALLPSQTLAANDKTHDILDVRAFLAAGGQQGPQRHILREGTWAINVAQFIVLTASATHALALSAEEQQMLESMKGRIESRDGFSPVVIKDNSDMLGVVTTHDGPGLPDGELIAPVVGSNPDVADYHNNFQDPERFLAAGGRRGLQLQVLVDGTYYINRLFATVELKPKTVIEVGYVGVVVSNTGAKGKDVTGAEYTHGELVARGERGVWSEPLLPGKYAINPYAARVALVPTTNFILKWNSETTTHKFDENLSAVTLITKDAFEPSLPLSVVVHIGYKNAPLVVQRFGDIKRLVEQTLDPMVSAYFKNVGQTKTLIQLLQDRSEIQSLAAGEMRSKFSAYNLELLEVLIGTPQADSHSTANAQSIDKILAQLRDRQVAQEQIETYKLQERAAAQEKSLNEARAVAAMQKQITESELSVKVQGFDGQAKVALATQEAEAMKVTAQAEKAREQLRGEGAAARIRAEGLAQAEATTAQVKAYEGEGARYQFARETAVRVAEAVRDAKVSLVPQVVMGAHGEGEANALSNALSMCAIGQAIGLKLTPASAANAVKQGAPDAASAQATPADSAPAA